MVAVAVSAVVLTIVWQVYRAEHRRFDVDQNRLAALQAATLLDEHLAQDLDRLAIEYAGATPGEPFTAERPVDVIDRGRGLVMRIFGAEEPARLDVVVDKVTYKQDQATGEITRTTLRGGNTRFPGLVVEQLQFMSLGAPLQLPPPAALGDQTPTRDERVAYVKYVLSCISPEVRARPAAQRPPEARVTLVGCIPLVLRSQRAHHWYWRPNRLELLELP